MLLLVDENQRLGEKNAGRKKKMEMRRSYITRGGNLTVAESTACKREGNGEREVLNQTGQYETALQHLQIARPRQAQLPWNLGI